MSTSTLALPKPRGRRQAESPERLEAAELAATAAVQQPAPAPEASAIQVEPAAEPLPASGLPSLLAEPIQNLPLIEAAAPAVQAAPQAAEPPTPTAPQPESQTPQPQSPPAGPKSNVLGYIVAGAAVAGAVLVGAFLGRRQPTAQPFNPNQTPEVSRAARPPEPQYIK